MLRLAVTRVGPDQQRLARPYRRSAASPPLSVEPAAKNEKNRERECCGTESTMLVGHLCFRPFSHRTHIDGNGPNRPAQYTSPGLPPTS